MNNNKCVFGYCKANKKDCKKCGENTKKQGFTGCVFATNKEEVTE